jgi:hypothetical protein
MTPPAASRSTASAPIHAVNTASSLAGHDRRPRMLRRSVVVADLVDVLAMHRGIPSREPERNGSDAAPDALNDRSRHHHAGKPERGQRAIQQAHTDTTTAAQFACRGARESPLVAQGASVCRTNGRANVAPLCLAQTVGHDPIVQVGASSRHPTKGYNATPTRAIPRGQAHHVSTSSRGRITTRAAHQAAAPTTEAAMRLSREEAQPPDGL